MKRRLNLRCPLAGERRQERPFQPVIPAYAGILDWTSALAGVTTNVLASARWGPGMMSTLRV